MAGHCFEHLNACKWTQNCVSPLHALCGALWAAVSKKLHRQSLMVRKGRMLESERAAHWHRGNSFRKILGQDCVVSPGR